MLAAEVISMPPKPGSSRGSNRIRWGRQKGVQHFREADYEHKIRPILFGK